MNNNVLVVGGDHHNTLGIIESLGQKGVCLYVILHVKNEYNYVLKSKYIKAGWICHTVEEVLSCMMTNFTDKEHKTIVFPSADDIACLMDENYHRLKECFIIPNAQEQGRINHLINKDEMVQLAQSVGLNVPKSWIIENDEIPYDIEYPCITKAISSVAGSKSNLKVCRTENELKSFLLSNGRCSVILIQKYIDKAFEFQFMGCSMYETNEVIIPGRSCLDRPKEINNEFFLEYDKCDDTYKDCLRKTEQFIKETKYSGLFSVEYLRDKNGVDYFMEMNFRNDGNSICVTDSGTNLPYLWYLYYSGGDYKEELNQSTIRKIYWQPEFWYFSYIFSGEISWKEWYRNLRRTNSYSNYFKNDKRPWRWFLYVEFRHGLAKLLRVAHIIK